MKHCHKWVQIDSTHNVTRYDLKLVVVRGGDDNDYGVPGLVFRKQELFVQDKLTHSKADFAQPCATGRIVVKACTTLPRTRVGRGARTHLEPRTAGDLGGAAPPKGPGGGGSEH